MPDRPPHLPRHRRMTDREREAAVRFVRFRQLRSACYLLAAAGMGVFVSTGWPLAAVAAVAVLLAPHAHALRRSGGETWGMRTGYAGLRGWSLALAQTSDVLILGAITIAVANVVDGHRLALTLVAAGLVLTATAIRRLGLWPTFR